MQRVQQPPSCSGRLVRGAVGHRAICGGSGRLPVRPVYGVAAGSRKAVAAAASAPTPQLAAAQQQGQGQQPVSAQKKQGVKQTQLARVDLVEAEVQQAEQRAQQSERREQQQQQRQLEQQVKQPQQVEQQLQLPQKQEKGKQQATQQAAAKAEGVTPPSKSKRAGKPVASGGTKARGASGGGSAGSKRGPKRRSAGSSSGAAGSKAVAAASTPMPPSPPPDKPALMPAVADKAELDPPLTEERQQQRLQKHKARRARQRLAAKSAAAAATAAAAGTVAAPAETAAAAAASAVAAPANGTAAASAVAAPAPAAAASTVAAPAADVAAAASAVATPAADASTVSAPDADTAAASTAAPPASSVAAPAANVAAASAVAARAAVTAAASTLAARATAAAAVASEEEQQQLLPTREQQQQEQQQRAGSTRLEITPKETDLMRWYADMVAAAELTHQQYADSSSSSSNDDAAAAAPATYRSTLQGPVQEWLDERLEYMGFEARAFPPLRPLSRPQQDANDSSSGSTSVAAAQQEDGDEGAADMAAVAAAAASSSGSSSSSCTTGTFAGWVKSEADLPLLASQWHDGHSWELRRSGLLHESHAAHAWEGSAEEHARVMIGLYEEFARDVAGVPVIAGRRSQAGSLPGAACSYTLEAMVGDGRALQVGWSHHLADNYARALAAFYLDSGGYECHMSQMGSGLAAALLGGMVLAHGDDAGMRLPPTLAPVQVVVVPVFSAACGRAELAAEAERVRGVLAEAGVRVAVDDRAGRQLGEKYGGSELRGVPLRIEVGPAELAAGTCTIARRDHTSSETSSSDNDNNTSDSDTSGGGGRMAGVDSEAWALASRVQELLDDVQADMRWGAVGDLAERVVDVTTYMELKDAIEAGRWARGPWAGSFADEGAIYAETGATLRCIPLQQPVGMSSGYNTCLYSGYQATEVAIFARSL